MARSMLLGVIAYLLLPALFFDSRTLPLVMFDRVKKGLDPSLNAISTVFIAATIVLVLISESLKRADRAMAKR